MDLNYFSKFILNLINFLKVVTKFTIVINIIKITCLINKDILIIKVVVNVN